MTVKRNDPCPCNSGKRYKKCCGGMAEAVSGGSEAQAVSTGPVQEVAAGTSNDDNQAYFEIHKAQTYLRMGRVDDAIACYEKALALRPDDAAILNDAGNAYVMRKRFDSAVKAYDKALLLESCKPNTHFNRAFALHELGRFEEAVVSYKNVLRINPSDVMALSKMSQALVSLEHYDAAIDAAREVLRINPDDAFAFNSWGGSLVALKNMKEGEEVLLKGLSIHGDNAELCLSLSSLYELRNQLDKSWLYLGRALEIAPEHPLANLMMAGLLRRQKKTAEAISLLTRLTVPENSTFAKQIFFELGNLYNLQGETDSAMDYFVRANRLWEKEYRVSTEYSQKAAAYRQSLERHRAQANFASGGFDPREAPIFMVGFPRSGSTLLQQILDAHPDLEAFDEKPVLSAVEQQIRARYGGNYPDILYSLPEEERANYRKLYWQEAGKYSEKTGVQIVDKYPLNIISCNLIACLFPMAKVIVNIRHPLDACLSCFMQNFEHNAGMSNFTTLENTVRFYVETMGLWLEYEKRLPLSTYRFSYERVVENFRQEVEALVGFLGIPWLDTLLEYNRHAMQKELITTASYAQVVEPIYTGARYRWKRYRKYLAPFMSQVRPFVQAFRYEDLPEGQPEGFALKL